MCVLYVAERNNKQLDIKYAIETILYNLPARQIEVNLSFFVNTYSNDPQVLRLIHRKLIKSEDVTVVNPEQSKGKDFLNFLSRLYGDRFHYDYDKNTIDFYCKPLEFLVDNLVDNKEHLKDVLFDNKINFNIENILSSDNMIPDSEEWRVPFTSIKVGPFPPNKTMFYSLDMVVKGNSFNYLLGGSVVTSIKGGDELLSSIKYIDLSFVPENSQWHKFFNQCINDEEKIVRPHTYDIIIQNKRGTLPKCYKVGPNVHLEYIEEKKLFSRVAWFTSDDPKHDFSIDVIFSERDDRIIRKSSIESHSQQEVLPVASEE